MFKKAVILNLFQNPAVDKLKSSVWMLKRRPAGVHHDNSSVGFTLIELLVVVLIIGILASVAVPKYMLAVRKTKVATALAFLEKLSEAQSLYFLANGTYPTDIESLDIIPPKVKPYSFSIEDGGFTVRAHAGAQYQKGFPILYAYGAYSLPHYGHLVNARHCIGGTSESNAVCRALGGRQDATYSYRFYLPSVKK